MNILTMVSQVESEMVRYPEIHEVIHGDGNQSPKLGTYVPPLHYLVLTLVVNRRDVTS